MADLNTVTISLTERAARELEAIRQETQPGPEKVLRVGVKGGGCSGLSYILEYDERNEFDQEFEDQGVTFVVDKRHALYVAGMEVDYQAGLNDRGFIFKNPNAKTTCGCGTSFSA